MLGNYLDEVRKKAPLIHNITNYVTINDVANMVLACGASPIMSDEPTDIEEITSICQGLNINMGMLNPRKIESSYIFLLTIYLSDIIRSELFSYIQYKRTRTAGEVENAAKVRHVAGLGLLAVEGDDA